MGCRPAVPLSTPAAERSASARREAERAEPATPASPATTPASAAAAGAGGPTASRRREADEYTRYELLAPETASFHILYEVTATTPGATAFFNPIRKGSEASGEAVFDQATGKKLRFTVVSGGEARAGGLPEADLDTSYIRVELPRPVPAPPREGGVRLLIEKTYKDAKSYFRKGADRIVFSRSLGIRRNSVVLPAGYEVVGCNFPAQILAAPGGRLAASFVHVGPEAVPFVLEARRLPQ
jgi:hypothetical protein